MSGREAPTDDAGHVLVVDDDSRIRQLLARYLGGNGFRVTGAADAAEARRKLAAIHFDLIVLDVMMPGEDGLSLTAALKADATEVPILLLTARSDSDDRVRGLEAGADDYLSKPFEPRELLLRLNNLLKRRAAAPVVPAVQMIRFGRFVYDLKREELKDGADVVRLTDRERQLLTLFATAPDGIVSREALAGPEAEVGERTVDVQINRLRRKIEDDPGNPSHLQTVRGVGYRLRWE